jgi:hypothetical protein
MKSSDEEFIKAITPDNINKNSEPEKITRLLEIIEEQKNEIKKLKRNQGLDIVKGKRQKPLNYMPDRDKL